MGFLTEIHWRIEHLCRLWVMNEPVPYVGQDMMSLMYLECSVWVLVLISDDVEVDIESMI